MSADLVAKDSTPARGIHRGIPFETYCSWDAVNSHLLNGFSRTAAHVRWDMLHGEGNPTRAKDIGGLLHMAVLEPARFESDTVVPPKIRKQGKKNLETWAAFEADNQGKTFVTQGQFDAVRFMRDNLLAHVTAGEFIRSLAATELSIVWWDAESGVRCKARLDGVGRIGEWPAVGDLKTGENMSQAAFERAIWTYGYHIQGAHYLAGAEAIAPVPSGNPFRRYVFPFVESKPPYCAGIYELDETALTAGANSRARYLRKWRSCVESETWPGYDAGLGLVSIPAWAVKQWSSED